MITRFILNRAKFLKPNTFQHFAVRRTEHRVISGRWYVNLITVDGDWVTYWKQQILNNQKSQEVKRKQRDEILRQLSLEKEEKQNMKGRLESLFRNANGFFVDESTFG